MCKQTCRHLFYLLQLLIVGIICTIHVEASAQVTEDFSDPILTSNPPWSGDLANFEVTAYQQLRLKSVGAGTSYLSTPLQCTGAIEWSIWVRLAFSPSANNNFRFYLVSDQADPSLADKAYYLQLGETGAADAVTLFYKNGINTKEICKGISGSIANAFSISIKVIRSKEGNWKILTDSTGGNIYTLDASAAESAPLPNGFLSLYCKYTASNSTGFYIDNILVQPLPNDIEPPVLTGFVVTENNQIELTFNEQLEKSASLQINNFRLANGTHPKSVDIDSQTATTIRLVFDQPLPIDQPFSLFVQGISDLVGNKTGEKEIQLIYHPLQWNDILINEIMANPIPSNGLPEVEYLELYNRSAFPIRLNKWSLDIGKRVQSLPDSTINAHEYRIIAAESNILKFKPYGKVLAIKSLSLTNEGTLIVLKNQLNQVIHAVDYKPSWHTTPAKKQGGWSLEMADPLHPYGAETNFQSSVDPLGGTPGKANSVNAPHPDLEAPQIASIYPIDSLHISISFTETVDSVLLLSPSTYSIIPGLDNPKTIIATNALYQSVILEIKNPLLKQTHYTLTINAALKDGTGNLLKIPVQTIFALPTTLQPNDIVINEIMFDPGVNKAEFIEIYNRTSAYYNLHMCYLATENTTISTPKQRVRLSEAGMLISPNQYLVLTGDKKQLLAQFPLLSKANIVEVLHFPTLSNDGGTIILTDSLQHIIDKVAYNQELHFPILRSTTGVSLERVDPEASSGLKSNWHSASEMAGFSTPGRVNSQHIPQNPSPTLLTLEPETFSPDNDGIDDNLIIRCNPEKQGCMLSLMIFDSNGRLVRKLVSNTLLSTENSFTWDGITDDHQRAKGGIYVVYAEIYMSSGIIQHIKKIAILAIRFTR